MTTVDRKIEKAAEDFSRSLKPCGPELARGALQLSFNCPREKKNFLGFSTKKEKMEWERWVILIRVDRTPRATGDAPEAVAERQRRDEQADMALRDRMMQVITTVVENRESLPPLPPAAESPMTWGWNVSGRR